MTDNERRARIEDIDRMLGVATRWGAHVSALWEERRALGRSMRAPAYPFPHNSNLDNANAQIRDLQQALRTEQDARVAAEVRADNAEAALDRIYRESGVFVEDD